MRSRSRQAGVFGSISTLQRRTQKFGGTTSGSANISAAGRLFDSMSPI
jgi:hypothetical protein